MDLDPVAVYPRYRGLSPHPRTHLNSAYDGGPRRFLELFGRMGVKATFFEVGEDLRLGENRALLREAAAARHEIASHSHVHRLELWRADAAAGRAELADAEAAIRDAVGVSPRGFRAPGWNVSAALFDALREEGYRYDSSLVPRLGRWGLPRWLRRTPWGPGAALLRAPLWEIPCGLSTPVPMPLVSSVAALVGDGLAAVGERLASFSPAPLVYVFHALDLVDYHQALRDPRLSGKPGLMAPLAHKRRRDERTLRLLGRGRS